MSDSIHEDIDLDGLTISYQSEDQLVVALDFGTTFSGIAYAFANGSKPALISIEDWPGLEGYQQPKIPTLICYNEDGNGFTWGGQMHKGEVVQGIKLLLDPDQAQPIYLPISTAKSDPKRLPKPPMDVAADIIKATYQHAMAEIETQIPAEYLPMCQRQYVLSVPAVWSDKAKDLTLQAAKHAGIFPVTLIKEPEAAAMYTLHELQDRSLAVGDAFVIVDAGGGTVDLISYEIIQLKPTLELKELVPGKGGMAGSLGLNRRFEEAFKDLVGEDQHFSLQKTRGFELALQQFDRSVKTAFRGDLEEDYFINFPMADLDDDPESNLESNCWNMKGSEVKAIFEPLINDIERLVDDQIILVRVKRLSDKHPKADEIKAIFLVGGFGSSEYLKRRLEEAYSGIQAIQPHGAWSAIVKGAVLSKLPDEASIVSTQATRHYGVSAMSEYERSMDASRQQVRDPSTGKMRVLCMTWYINRGEDLQREQTIRFPFYRSLVDGFHDSRLLFDDELIQSENNVAPRYPSPGATRQNFMLTADLRGINRNHFKKRIGIYGQIWVDIHYNLVITVKPAVIKFSLEVKGEEMECTVQNTTEAVIRRGRETWVGYTLANLALAMRKYTVITISGLVE